MSNLIAVSIDVLPLDILCFSLALWLGAYLLKRNWREAQVCLAGISLILYAWAQASLALSAPASAFSMPLRGIGQWLLCLPTLLWTGVLIFSLPEDTQLRKVLARGWFFVMLPLIAIGYVMALLLHTLLPLLGLLLLSLAVLVPASYSLPARRKLLLITFPALVVTTAIALAAFPHSVTRLLVCCTLLILGTMIAARDAAHQGETLLPDLSRSFDYAFLTALIFGGQIALLMVFGTGMTFPALLFLLSMVATALIVQVFSRDFVNLLDTIAFATFPQLRQARAELHTATDVLPRLQEEIDLDGMEEAEFTRLTRRALSNMGDLSRLASSPLTRLPVIKARLRARGVKDEDVLEGAAELKMVLTESICRLKPRGKGEFGTTDEWRYYNALYFPYVIGIKPYSQRFQPLQSDPIVEEALNWFRTQIPERTLHNWQNTAARLVAQDLRDQKVPLAANLPGASATSGRKWQSN